MKKYILSIFLGAAAISLSAQDKLNRDSLLSDLSLFTKQLEATHPDPYSGFGGRVDFRKNVVDFRKHIANNDCTTEEFINRLNSFIAPLQDAHTFVMRQNNKTKPLGIFALGTGVIPNGIIIKRIPKEFELFLGSKIKRVNGVDLDTVLLKSQSISPCENIYGQYSLVSNRLADPAFIQAVAPGDVEKLDLLVEGIDGQLKSLYLPFVKMDLAKTLPAAMLNNSWSEVPDNSYIGYKFLDHDKKVMFFRLTSIMGRENAKFVIDNKWQGGYDQVKMMYNNILKKSMPLDTLEAINGIPSFSETFLSMLKEMKTNSSDVLIVDLRGNGGGFTPIVLPSIYQMYGDKALEDMGTQYHRLVSPSYLNKINKSLEQYNADSGKNLNIGDFDFEGDKLTHKPIETDHVKVRNNFIDNSMCYMKDELRKQNGKPFYTAQKLYVITDEKTFSAAFHYAFYLWKMGAIIVGVPSKQAPNTFMEQTMVELPYTGLDISISNSIQIFLPTKDHRAKVFTPDMIPSYEDYVRYNFDKHSELLYLLDSKDLKHYKILGR